MRSCARGPQRGGAGQLGSKIFPSPLNLTPPTHTFTHPHHQVPTVVKVIRHSAMFDYHNDMWEYATPPICPVCTRYDQFVNTSTLMRHAFFIFMLFMQLRRDLVRAFQPHLLAASGRGLRPGCLDAGQVQGRRRVVRLRRGARCVHSHLQVSGSEQTGPLRQ